ncbi:uncharacterized protein BKCO1_4000042 [Diplodia corticola]|uniref:Subtilisin-like serine protease n=1 Tax=Diplodia corticola TaxID=236234 RepID=A0A1J9QVZ6_9PEZI|nr:uncharacterized protein BKCO1_4000042 [Diplodia corticola]OJD32170.1 hypothetical protein BKCO1_4000042 [Diplodia corticola]
MEPPLSRPPFEHSLNASEIDLLPATFRDEEDNLIAPSSCIKDFLRKELSVERIDKVKKWLWMSGRLVPPRPLHHQVLLRRSLTITEQPDLHLVWSKDRIFLKPLPQFLLDSVFWKSNICTSHEEGKRALQQQAPSPSASNPTVSAQMDLAMAARGFLFSYTALIAYHSDFLIARANGLVPPELEWPAWKKIAQATVNDHTYGSISPRYRYGELRLSRLNKIYRFADGAYIRGFSRVDAQSQYQGFVADNFGKIIGISGYVVIVLTAMQVGLATNQLQSNATFHSASYGLTVFSIVVPICAGVVIFVMLACLFVRNCRFASQDWDRRCKKINNWDHVTCGEPV